MKTRLLFIFILLSFKGIFAQNQGNFCGITHQSQAESEGVESFIRQFQKNAVNLRPSAETIYIPLKLHVVINDAGSVNSSFFRSKDFNQSLAYTNAVYKKANIQFFVTGSINYIKSSKLQNLVIKNTETVVIDGYTENIVEEELCRPHEIPNAINLFFVNNTNIDGFISASYAKYPNTTSVQKISSYRIIMNAQAIGGYGDIKYPGLPHEIGHHFSLYHPFDYNGGAKELVKRSTGANCETTGDFLCDTPADPYNDIPSNSPDRSLCSELPPNYRDANGDIYKPDMSNIMTYYSNYCKSGFTAGQYERILAGLALRKTSATFGKYDAPDATVTPPTITGINNYEGGVMQLFLKDNSNNETGFIIERASSATGEFVAIGGIAENTTIYTDELVGIDNVTNTTFYYRVRPSNSKNAYSNVFEKTTKTKFGCIPPVNIKCGETTFNMVFRTVKAAGSTLNETYAPCRSVANYSYNNTKEYLFQTNTDYTIEGTIQNEIQAYHNIYAWIDKNKNGSFDENERIYATNYSAINKPADKNFKFIFSTKDLSGTYTLRLRMGFVTNLRDACAGVQQGETNDYVINVAGGFSLSAGAITSPAVCPGGTITVPLTFDGAPLATTKFSVLISDKQGANFKEISSVLEGANIKVAIPKDFVSGTGFKIKVVSTNPSSESVSPSSITIMALPTAKFETKEASIQQYQSLDVKLNLTGDLTIKIKLSDNQTFELNDLNPTVRLSPNVSTDYKISAVNNTCGEGSVDNSILKIIVNQVLGLEKEKSEEYFKIFPNPTSGVFTLQISKSSHNPKDLEIVDTNGRILFFKKITKDEEEIDLKGLTSGMYFIKIKTDNLILNKRLIKISQ
ncbi:MAG: T9SS type A sorting domain-containing protein [Cytophagaceae bacterium]|nr:T9SS type A sorting domain-containing protein [Cytophagaceae bacterium]